MIAVGTNSIKLAGRLARNLIVVDPFNLNADVALDVLTAINAGLATFYREVPGIYKRSTLSHTIRAPREVALVFQAQYSRLVANDSFVIRDQGCTVRFSDSSADNIVTGPNSVLDNYLGSTLSISATIYSDAVPIQDVIERIIGNIRVYDSTRTSPTVLTRNERLRSGLSRVTPLNEGDECYYPPEGVALGSVGRPQYYYFEPMGVSQGGEPEFILRIAPLPDKDYTVRLEAELSTQRLVFEDLKTARSINVPGAFLDDVLIPLCEAELVTSAFWRDAKQIKTILDKRDMALSSKIPKIASDVAPSSNYIGTPRGY